METKFLSFINGQKYMSSIIILLFLFNPDYSKGITQEHSDSLKIAIDVTTSPAEKVKILLELSGELTDKSPSEALQFALEALELSENNKFSNELIRSRNALAEIFMKSTRYKEAIEMSIKARNEAEESGDSPEMIRAILNIGIIYNDLGNYEKSSEYFFTGLKLSEQIDDKKYIAKSLNSIGVLYHNQQNYEKALEYYFKALNLSKEIGDKKGVAKGLNNIASIYGTQGNSEKARVYLVEALTYNLQENELYMAGVNYLNLGYYYQEQGQFDSAKYFYESARDIYNELGNSTALISTEVFFTEYYIATGDLDESLRHAREAMKGANRHGLKKLIYETASLMNTIFLKKGDSLLAYKYKALTLQIKDSLNIEEKQTELTSLELQYALDKAEQQIRLDRQRLVMIRIIIGISLVFIVIFIILLWSRLRMKAKAVIFEKEKLKSDLELQSKDLTSNAMNLMKKNETLSKIADRLKVLQKESVGDETRNALSKIRIELNKLVEDEGWEEFEVRFKQVHINFYNGILKKFPGLTPQEQRLCAFLRLNMTTKEISDLTGQRLTAIEMSRSRLRKKLQLTNTNQSLVNFLNQF